jgi:sortase A
VRLARINTFLLIAIVLINGYIITLPLIPGLLYWWQTRDGKQTIRIEQRIRALALPNVPEAEYPIGNRLMVPGIAFDQLIFEGNSPKTLNNGLWHRPQTSTPDKGGNVVFAGHRLTYTNPKGTLYHLDKVNVGDEIGLWWRDKLYTYTVIETKIVGADALEIEAPTSDRRLTIYTCTPLWLPKDRLVVVAKPMESPHE